MSKFAKCGWLQVPFMMKAIGWYTSGQVVSLTKLWRICGISRTLGVVGKLCAMKLWMASFRYEFDYPDQFDPNENCDDRRDHALKARYGAKPVVYPKPEDLPDLTEADLSSE